MALNSAEFFIIFFSLLPIYFLFKKNKWIPLLIFNYYFYFTFYPKFVVLIFLTSIASYILAIGIHKSKNIIGKRLLLILSIVLALVPLLYYKYYNFIGSNLFSNFTTKDLIIPIGISFYTLQVISYVADVYKEKYPPYLHIGKYLCYVSFFGTILSGPIERANNFIPQLSKKITFDENRIFEGLKYISWGLFLKMVVSDNLGVLVDKIYGAPSNYPGIPLIIATIFFGIQLYTDFNGYSHLALGFSKVVGIDITENFKFPYFRQGVIDFWRGWHISLSTWLRDYIYFPLGGSRKGKVRTFINRMIVFLVSGFWHNAGWNFIIWGGLHGAYQAVEGTLPKKANKSTNAPRKILGVIFTFILVDFAWIFFRADSAHSALYIITHLFSNLSISGLNVIFTMIVNKRIFLMMILLIIFTFVVEFFKYQDKPITRNKKIAFYLVIWLMIIFLSQSNSESFIYFKF